MIEVMGWIGAAAFALCGLPQAAMSIKQGHARGISSGMLTLWAVGEACTLVYVSASFPSPSLLTNYLLNLLWLAIIIRYKAWERAET